MRLIVVSILVLGLCIVPACKGKQQRGQPAPGETTGALTDTLARIDTTTRPDTMGRMDTTGRVDTTGGTDGKDGAGASSDTTKAPGKTTWKSPDKGIGPIKEVKVGPIDTTMASNGQKIFQAQCIVCHALDTKKIGPPLRTVANDRPPEFIMNMLLNTEEMQKKDPEVKKLIAEYKVLMTPPNLTQDQARSVLEYLRQAATQPAGKQ